MQVAWVSMLVLVPGLCACQSAALPIELIVKEIQRPCREVRVARKRESGRKFGSFFLALVGSHFISFALGDTKCCSMRAGCHLGCLSPLCNEISQCQYRAESSA
ncbi:hypothetical protein BDZ91DRAFT_723229 [Kalaharituber pfeilii]|nr:hypothetical protein BDZ91DRAFT_723229 [Kalaharituber pfeilii]